MSDVFSQIYIQIIFAVKNRQALIREEWEDELYKYITGIVQNRGNKMLAIGGMPDHIHIFIGLKPSESLSDLVREIKKSSNDLINTRQFCQNKFEWQTGFGVFSYSQSHRNQVCKYILNQKKHHQKNSFKEEFLAIISNFEVEIGRKKLFDFFIPDSE